MTDHSINYGFLIERTGKKLKQSLQRIFNDIDAGITVDQWVILFELHKHGSLSQNMLGEHTYKDAPTVTRIIDLLTTKGLVRRKLSAEDRRKYFIELTDKGNKTVRWLLPYVTEFRENGWKGMKVSELRSLEAILGKIFDNMSGDQ